MDHFRTADRIRELVKKPQEAAPKKPTVILDGVADVAEQDIALRAAASVKQWAETQTEELGEGETLADRLLALLVGIADDNQDGEIDDDEADLLEIATNAAADYLAAQGVSDDDVISLLEDFDVATAERVFDLLGASEDDADLDGFVFDSDATEAALDSAAMDAVYKKRIVVRGGQKVRINKRVSGTVRLTSGQKVAIRKARMKSHSAAAVMGRVRSMRKRQQLNLKTHPAT